MEKKYKVEFGKINKLFICEPNELQRKVKESFKIQQPFQFQVYDDDFAEWIGVTDIEQLPTLSKLKVEISKCTAQCTLGWIKNDQSPLLLEFHLSQGQENCYMM